MNINTLSEHRCADKCTDFKATREQCNHCLVSCPEISDNSSYSKIPNSSNFVVGDAVVYLSAKKLDTIHYIRTVSTKFEYVVLDNADVVNFDSIRHATVAEFTNNRRLPQGVTFADVDLGDDAHIENHISPLCPSDLQDVLDHIKYNEVSESAYSISYSHLTKSTEEQIQFFNKQKKIAEDEGDQQEAISFDHQADGAYLLWLRLTKGCRNPSDNERFQVLVGAKA